MQPSINILRCLALALPLFFPAPHSACAEDWSLNLTAAHGEESSQAYDLYLQYTFDHIYSNDTISIKPLVSSGISLWERPGQEVWGFNLNGGLILEFSGNDKWRPFIAGTFGIAVISAENFNDLKLGQHEQFRSRGSVGINFGENFRHMLKCDITHYSNGSLSSDNSGYNTIGLSYGYTF